MTVSQGIDTAKLWSSECEKLQSENATLQTYPRNFDMMILDIRIFCMKAELTTACLWRSMTRSSVLCAMALLLTACTRPVPAAFKPWLSGDGRGLAPSVENLSLLRELRPAVFLCSRNPGP